MHPGAPELTQRSGCATAGHATLRPHYNPSARRSPGRILGFPWINAHINTQENTKSDAHALHDWASFTVILVP